jgi:phenylalanyl-tRNA synthetase beta chain
MKISVNWLKEFVEVDLSAAELADALTMTGLEVEGVAALAHGIDGVVIAEIVGIKPHPNKDELTLCQVSDGAREYQVVCGAKNMKTGDKGVLARHGATLAGGMKIKRGKFRGAMSEGMLCSEAELGLAEEAEEIIILEPDAPVGEDPLSFYQLCDEVLDITVTPNRPDCLSVLGVAREVAAITGKRLIRRECPLTLSQVFGPGDDRCKAWPVAFECQDQAVRGRHSADKQPGGRDQLRDDGTGPAAARL